MESSFTGPALAIWISVARVRSTSSVALKARGIPTAYKEIPGKHYWFLWRDFLGDYASILFK